MIPLHGLVEGVAQLLLKKHSKLVTAESCTGGLLAANLTEIPGASQWFDRGLVTYTNEAKQELLAVPEAILLEYGAVSEEVAKAMAEGALRFSHAQLAVSITGIAGPDGGSQAKPVGRVCFGFAAENKATLTFKKQFSGNRQAVRQQACETALKEILHYFD